VAAAVYNGPSQFCCCFHTCTAFHLFSDHRLANSFCAYFGDTLGLPYRVGRNPGDPGVGFWLWLWPLFVLVCFFCWRNANLAGRFACRRCVAWFCLFVSPWISFYDAKTFHNFAIYLTASLCQDRGFRANRCSRGKSKLFPQCKRKIHPVATCMKLKSRRHTQPDPQSCRVRSLGGEGGEPKNKRRIKRPKQN